MLERIYKILPRYAFLPVIISLGLNFAVYCGNRLFTGNLKHYDLSIGIDKELPFVMPMMAIYLLAFVTWIIGYIVIGRESKEVCYNIMSGEQIAKIICLFFFIILPTSMVRPEVQVNDFFSWLTNLVYILDSADNLFPSIHCLESWMIFRGALKCKKVGNKYKIFMFVAAILVFTSTLLVKQHLFVDVIGGVLIAEIGLFLSKKLKTSRIYYKIVK